MAANQSPENNADIWLVDHAGRLSPFTTDPARDLYPVWSRDGRWIAFSHDGKSLDLYRKRADLSGEAELLLQGGESKTAQSWSPDRKFLLYITRGQTTGQDLWVSRWKESGCR